MPLETARDSPSEADFNQQSNKVKCTTEPAGECGATRKALPAGSNGCQVDECDEPLPENDARYYKVRFHGCVTQLLTKSVSLRAGESAGPPGVHTDTPKLLQVPGALSLGSEECMQPGKPGS
jgi:hypothetical protein